MNRLYIITAFVLLMTNHSAFAQTQSNPPVNTLTIQVKGAKIHFGSVRVNLMAGEMGQPFATNTKDAADQDLTFKFENLPEGTIGVYVFQDENGNFQLDHDAKGLPIEPCAVQQIQIQKGEHSTQVDLFIPEASNSAMMDKAKALSKDSTSQQSTEKVSKKSRKERRSRD